MAHTIPLADCLDLDAPSVSLVDLLLFKLQIEQITEKDLIDIGALLGTHELDPTHRQDNRDESGSEYQEGILDGVLVDSVSARGLARARLVTG